MPVWTQLIGVIKSHFYRPVNIMCIRYNVCVSVCYLILMSIVLKHQLREVEGRECVAAERCGVSSHYRQHLQSNFNEFFGSKTLPSQVPNNLRLQKLWLGITPVVEKTGQHHTFSCREIPVITYNLFKATVRRHYLGVYRRPHCHYLPSEMEDKYALTWFIKKSSSLVFFFSNTLQFLCVGYHNAH